MPPSPSSPPLLMPPSSKEKSTANSSRVAASTSTPFHGLLQSATSLTFPKVLQAFLMLQPQLEHLLHDMQPNCIVADIFYSWTTGIAAELGIPRLAFNGSSFFGYCVEQCIKEHKLHLEVEFDNDKFQLPGLPDFIEMTRSQLPNWILTPNNVLSPLLDDIRESEKRSYGKLMNSFHEMESPYEEHLNKVMGIKTWSIGPISLMANKEAQDKEHRGGSPSIETTKLLQWLNQKQPSSVLYISFGTLHVRMKPEQISEIAHAIQESSRNFIWVINKNNDNDNDEEADIDDHKGFGENTIKAKNCLIIRGWAPQLMILEHEAVGGFVTHCGWNSILEGVSSGVAMITWALFAEQFYNEKLLTDVLKIGVGVGAQKWWDLGEEREVVKREDIGKAVGLLMGGSGEAVEMRKRAAEMGEAANRAVSLSQIKLVSLFEELQTIKLNRNCNG